MLALETRTAGNHQEGWMIGLDYGYATTYVYILKLCYGEARGCRRASR